MNNRFGGKSACVFNLTALVLCGMALFGCQSNNVGGGGYGEGGPLVNIPGEAWIFDDGDEGAYFAPDGRVFAIYYNGTRWVSESEGTYRIIESGSPYEYTVTITGSNVMNGTYDVTLSDDGRTVSAVSQSGGYMTLTRTLFKQNGEYVGFYKQETPEWKIGERGTYSTKGSNLTLTNSEGSITMPYSVSGNTLKITIGDGEVLTYTKTSGVNIQ